MSPPTPPSPRPRPRFPLPFSSLSPHPGTTFFPPQTETAFQHDQMRISQVPIRLPSPFPGTATAATEDGIHPRGSNGDSPPSKRARGDRPAGSGGDAGERVHREDKRVFGGDEGNEGPVGCVCYVCEAPSLPGKFDVKTAVKLKVPRVSTEHTYAQSFAAGWFLLVLLFLRALIAVIESVVTGLFFVGVVIVIVDLLP